MMSNGPGTVWITGASSGIGRADGGGPSLEWRGINYDNFLPSSWMPSNALGGSPGSANSTWAD
jgi:hypothetical protein